MWRSGNSVYTSENFFRVSCLSDDTPTRTDSPPIFENSSSPGRPATWRFVSAYTSWPSVTMQPTEATCSSSWTRAMIGYPPPMNCRGNRGEIGAYAGASTGCA